MIFLYDIGGLWLKSSKIPFATNIRDLFTSYLDITTPPTQKLLSLFASQCDDDDQVQKLKELASVRNLHDLWLLFCRLIVFLLLRPTYFSLVPIPFAKGRFSFSSSSS